MEKERSRLTKQILNLTLEILYLLTGEDYTLVKKTTGDRMTPSNHHGAPGGWSRNQSDIIEPSTPLPTPEINDKKILEVTQKILELLTGEVPIRCQDVAVYFSMEEWEYVEGHKELYKDVMMVSQPALTSPDGSSNRNRPERCPRPLYSRDYTQENAKTRQNDQAEDVIVIKAEVSEEAEKRMSCKPCKEENVHPEIRTDSADTQKDLKTERKKEEHGRIKEEENPIEIRIDGRYRRYKMAQCSAVLPNGVIEDDNIMADPSGENPILPNLQAVSQVADLSSDPSTQDGTMVDHLYPGTYKVCRAEEPFLCYVSNNYCSQGSKRTSQPKSDLTCSRSECGKCFGLGSSFTRCVPAKTHPCSQCGRCFSQKSNLLRHLRFHTVDRPYMCSACSRCFSQKSDLLRHQRIHTGEKPYSCLVCGRCFAQKSNLLRHHRSHSGERPFSCSQCGKCFAKKQDLVSHQTKHTKMT